MNSIPYTKLYQIPLYQIYQIGPKKRIFEIGMSPSSDLIWKKDRNKKNEYRTLHYSKLHCKKRQEKTYRYAIYVSILLNCGYINDTIISDSNRGFIHQ